MPAGHAICRRLMRAVEEHEIPRSEKIGGPVRKVEGVGHEETSVPPLERVVIPTNIRHFDSLPSFLSFLQPVPKTPPKFSSKQLQDTAKVVTTPRSCPSSPQTAITDSMLGQPPTVTTPIMVHHDYPSSDTDISGSDGIGLRGVLKILYPNEGERNPSGFNVDPRDFILKERLDEKESYLMDGMCLTISPLE